MRQQLHRPCCIFASTTATRAFSAPPLTQCGHCLQVLWHEPNYAYLALLVPAVMMLCGMCVLSARRHVQVRGGSPMCW
jgi:hypothetical protein